MTPFHEFVPCHRVVSGVSVAGSLVAGLVVLGGFLAAPGLPAEPRDGDGEGDDAREMRYADHVRESLDILMEHGTDRYGPRHTPVLVSILDARSRTCPETPEALDERWRVTRRDRRNPAGSNLLMDQPTLRSLWALSESANDPRYARFANEYVAYALEHLVDRRGLLWWGWHRHYDVYRDEMTGHQGNHHEIHAIHCVLWNRLWEIDAEAVRAEIEAIWEWHVIDKGTGEINRHADGQRGCDFAMSAGSFIHAFSFMYSRTGEEVWLERACLLVDYFRNRGHPDTSLFPDRPNAGRDRFDGSHFVTSITGLYAHALLKSFELTGEAFFRDSAVTCLEAYARHGFDASTGRFWGTLNLDGTPVPGPRLLEGYGAYEPRGHLDLWEPYVAGYQYPIYTAQVYAYAFELTRKPVFLETAKRFAAWIERNLPAGPCQKETWYAGYAEVFAPHGTYAGKYGRTISFLVHLHVLTGEPRYLGLARRVADEAIVRLKENGLLRGHPAKPYYEATDGVGFLLYALLQLDEVLRHGRDAPGNRTEGTTASLGLDNW